MDTMSLTPDSTASRSRTEVITQEDILDTTSQPILRLRLKKPKSDKKVGWRAGTVDNEHMGKKKSKCCCIYKKPTVFGESSSEDDEECEHCFGHPEKRRRNRKPTDDQPENNEHEHDHEHEHEHNSHNHSHKDEDDKEIQNNNEETIK